MLPPGRLRLATRPSRTGSPPAVKTMGMVMVARGTHLVTFLGWPATGKPVRMRAIVIWHFKGDELWGETVFFDNASLLKQIGASIDVPQASGQMKPATFKLDDQPLIGHGQTFE